MLAFLPDAQESASDVLLEVEAVPTIRGYAGPPSMVSTGFSALGVACNGAASLARLDGGTRFIAGTQAALYEGSGGSWSDVSSAPYTTGDAKWRFAQFGNTSLAISKAIQLQQSSSGAFAAVSNAPKAALMESVAGFIMLANCDDTGTGLSTGYGDQPHRWWCSQLFNPTGTWAPSITTQATSGLLVSAPGPITALKRLGDSCVAYKERALYVGQYVGPNAVWDWQLVPGEIGVQSNENVVSIGTAHLFIGYEDIYYFDGSRPVAIGEGVKEWFFSRLNKAYAYKIEGIHDYNNQAVWWFYPSGSSATLNAALVYNYKAKKWGHVTISVECPVFFVQSGVTYDDLGSLYSTYDDLPDIAYDSPFWQAGAPSIGVIDSSHTPQTLTGASATSFLKTGFVGDDSVVSLLTRVRPRYRTKPATAQITHSHCMALGDVPQSIAPVSINGDRFDLLHSARWHQVRVDFTGEVEIERLIPTLVAEGDE